jgi:PTS system mannose-specific IIA component
MTGTVSGVGVVVVTHGQLASELLNATEMIVGDLSGVVAVSIGWHDDVGVARESIAQAITRVDSGHGVLILTDMFGGTPSNLAITFLDPGRVKTRNGRGLAALARAVAEQGQAAIRVASELLRYETAVRADGA